MMRLELQRRAEEFATYRGLSLIGSLGFGQDGEVWLTSDDNAIKVFERRQSYLNECKSYQRLKEKGISLLAGFAIPRLIDFDENLLAIKMSLVSPPYLIDFGKAYVDHDPNYSPEVLADWQQAGEELFGDRWSTVYSLLAALRALGIYYFDAKPSNITFKPETTD